MIRFGVVLTVVLAAMGLLAGGVLANSLLLVYLAIGAAALAAVMLTVGVVIWRHEVFGDSAAGRTASAAPPALVPADGAAPARSARDTAGQATIVGAAAPPADAAAGTGDPAEAPPPTMLWTRPDPPEPAGGPQRRESAGERAGQPRRPDRRDRPEVQRPGQPDGPDHPERSRQGGPQRLTEPAAQIIGPAAADQDVARRETVVAGSPRSQAGRESAGSSDEAPPSWSFFAKIVKPPPAAEVAGAGAAGAGAAEAAQAGAAKAGVTEAGAAGAVQAGAAEAGAAGVAEAGAARAGVTEIGVTWVGGGPLGQPPAAGDIPAGTDAPADAGEGAPAGEAAPAGDAGGGRAARGPDAEVTVVPGITRYHRGGCILIRFLGPEDLETMTRQAAETASYLPCRACRPDQDLTGE